MPLLCSDGSFRFADLESVFYVLAELVLGEPLPWCCKDEAASCGSDGEAVSNSFNGAQLLARHVRAELTVACAAQPSETRTTGTT